MREFVCWAWRNEIAVLTANLSRLKAIMAAEVDEDCLCDHCAGFSVAFDMGDTLLKHLQDVVDWLGGPLRMTRRPASVDTHCPS
jgi:hypothetical protein